MNARIVDKPVEVDGRNYIVKKYDVFTSVKISKMFVAKILPVFQSFLPVLGTYLRGGAASSEEAAIAEKILDNIEEYLSLDGIARALDLVSEQDMDFIMSRSLMCCYEQLPAGPAQVMTKDGKFGVIDLEHDPLVALRLVCEAVLWGLEDFFTADRLRSIMSPLSASFQLNRLT